MPIGGFHSLPYEQQVFELARVRHANQTGHPDEKTRARFKAEATKREMNRRMERFCGPSLKVTHG